MTLSALAPEAVAARLKQEGLALRIGPFSARVRSRLPDFAPNLALLYADYPLDDGSFQDFHVELRPGKGLRRWIRRQVDFSFDGISPFKPLPADQAFALFEWGLNWCISSNAHQFLIVHAAVVERDGSAILLPGPPGAGKSTLCAGLISRGWRLLSDELALVAEDGRLVPVPRPVSLKNRSIDVIRAFAPDAVIGRIAHDTAKGTVGHLRPPAESVRRSAERPWPRRVIFPRYVPDAPPVLQPHPRARAFLYLATNALNYDVLGTTGFERLAGVIDRCECSDFSYGRLDDAIETFAKLAAADAETHAA